MLDNWQTFARHLAERYSVYTLDLRNHGRSPHSDVFTYPDMSNDIGAFLHDHHIRNASILGHSLGGKVAMQTALVHPELIRKLIVVDIGPKGYPSGHDAIIDALLNTDPQGAESRGEIERLLMQKLHDTSVVRFLMKNIGRQEDGTLYWRMNLPVLAANYANTTHAITSTEKFTGPTLFVRGGRSKYVLDDDWPGILNLFPAAELKTIPDAGHWVHADAMQELLDVTQNFLRDPK